MIIGNGLIGSKFRESEDLFEDNIIFTSGVSNSIENDIDDFKREEELILKTINNKFKFIYFSSILVNTSDSPYYKHKHNMENLIKENTDNYLIIRLPQVIGKGGNKNNIINKFRDSIINGEEILIYMNIYRSIIDVDDVVEIIKQIKNNETCKTINISGFEILSALQICNLISDILKIEPKIKYIKNNNYIFNNWRLKNSPVIENIDVNRYNYTERVLKKYLL